MSYRATLTGGFFIIKSFTKGYPLGRPIIPPEENRNATLTAINPIKPKAITPIITATTRGAPACFHLVFEIR